MDGAVSGRLMRIQYFIFSISFLFYLVLQVTANMNGWMKLQQLWRKDYEYNNMVQHDLNHSYKSDFYAFLYSLQRETPVKGGLI